MVFTELTVIISQDFLDLCSSKQIGELCALFINNI